VLAGTVGISFGFPQVFVVLLGCMAFTQEFRYGTISSTYLIEPRRTRVLAAKWLSVGLASVVIAAATLALSVPFGIALIRSRNGDATVAGQFWQMVAAGFVVMVAYGVIGVAVGALVRNQIVAVVGVLVWMLAVEQIVISSFPAVGRWMPIGATFSLLQLGPGVQPGREAAVLIHRWARVPRVHGRGGRPRAPHHTKQGCLVTSHRRFPGTSWGRQ
jgi:ABC-type transport system involved in multi-copper enzyme maturation permease subunit